jgi:hypothetical protein
MDALIVTVFVVAAVALTTIIALNIVKRESLSMNAIRILDNSDINWRNSSQPWNNCLDANKVYCSGAYTRQPGGCMKMRYYPKCGLPCGVSNACPEACGNCVHGSCQ